LRDILIDVINPKENTMNTNKSSATATSSSTVRPALAIRARVNKLIYGTPIAPPRESFDEGGTEAALADTTGIAADVGRRVKALIHGTPVASGKAA
jgi:hypothetical protein